MIRFTPLPRLGAVALLTIPLLVGLARPAAATVRPQDGKGDNAFFYGTPCINFRTGPHLSSSVIACVDYGHSGGIYSSTIGDWVYGLWGWTKCWDYVTYADPSGNVFSGYASDGFVYTGKSEC
jgi:hypothetical protein